LFAVFVPILSGLEGAGGAAPPAVVLSAVFGMFAFWVAMIVLNFVSYAWMLFIGTRTLFILPLIADRRLDFSTAWRLSWEETRHGFWELLLLSIIASIISVLGMYVCYVGIIVSFPLGIMIIDAAYEDRFAGAAEVLE
jgi:membrane-anchored glycerophosphoryl diester phosphodiesterase (GDPDase)